ncbi:hypothetical protein QJS10_CPB20g00618 [Acorus calamus]|uniref:MHD1 domain-containing protein n=1 Tax=Acorus calamus TaxID=4465 RepID=A0AAV9CAL7_ACOCL|nr:hypothetical protein QJS10_CPB20g00618 [Acorus calamus]
MASLFRDRSSSVGDSKRETHHNGSSTAAARSIHAVAADLPSPFGDLGRPISDAELRETAYEVFVGACRTSGGKPLTYVPQSSASPTSPALQRSMTSAAASKMKKALGLKSSSSSMKRSPGSKESLSSKARRPATVGELMRVQMGVSEQTDGRIRRGLLRIAAGQLGRRIDSMVLPLELLQQFKPSDFTDQHEYEAWQARNLKVLEAGLLLHPHLPLEKSDSSAQRLRQMIRGAFDRPLETGKNSESMQVLRTTVMSLAYRSFDGTPSETAHWADGCPLNLRLYQMLLEACFESNEEGSIIEEIDEVMELIKKTWVIFGMNQTLHNLCFTWILFHRFVSTGQTDIDLLSAADNQLVEVAKDAKATKDQVYSKRMEKADSSRRSSRNQTNPTHVLSILAKDISDLATKEKQLFSPILQRWHPLAAGVAVATLHACYGSELKQFISGVTELTPDSVQVLKAADKLEKDLVHIAVEDSVDSEDGGKSLIREMPPYEAEAAVANLAKIWIKTRVDRLKEWVDRNLQQELPIPMHPALLPDLAIGIDRSLQSYISKAKSGCGPARAFTRQDSQIIEDDFKSLKDLFLADGDGLPEELVEKAATQIKNVIPLFRTDTESLIERYRRLIMEAYGPSTKSKFPMPTTSGHWSPTDPNTILRVLCYRNDEDATKFLKKAYNLPKKI